MFKLSVVTMLFWFTYKPGILLDSVMVTWLIEIFSLFVIVRAPLDDWEFLIWQFFMDTFVEFETTTDDSNVMLDIDTDDDEIWNVSLVITVLQLEFKIHEEKIVKSLFVLKIGIVSVISPVSSFLIEFELLSMSRKEDSILKF